MTTHAHFIVDDLILEAIDDYDRKSKIMQYFLYEGNPDNYSKQQIQELVNDPLIFNIPIYDVLHRKYAAFSSFTEACWKGDEDPKGNGKLFEHLNLHGNLGLKEWIFLFYTFRLCGSGINYKPKTHLPWGTHGFGNFWIIEDIRNGRFKIPQWLESLYKNDDKPFTNNKGYLLPQFTFSHLKKSHLRYYILEYAQKLIVKILDYIVDETDFHNSNSIKQIPIYKIVNKGNEILNEWGFKKQNFVLTAFAMDLAEYFPRMVDRKSKVYAGTNAAKCLKLIFKKTYKQGDFEFLNQCMDFLANRYGAEKYDVEDSRACDVIRYLLEYQSDHHIAMNNGNTYKNNSVLKKTLGVKEYYELIEKLK